MPYVADSYLRRGEAYASGEGRAGLHVIPFKFGKEVAQAVDAVL
jgi:hypothetical protein